MDSDSNIENRAQLTKHLIPESGIQDLEDLQDPEVPEIQTEGETSAKVSRWCPCRQRFAEVFCYCSVAALSFYSLLLVPSVVALIMDWNKIPTSSGQDLKCFDPRNPTVFLTVVMGFELLFFLLLKPYFLLRDRIGEKWRILFLLFLGFAYGIAKLNCLLYSIDTNTKCRHFLAQKVYFLLVMYNLQCWYTLVSCVLLAFCLCMKLVLG